MNDSLFYEGDLVAVSKRLRDAVLDADVVIAIQSTGNATAPEDFELIGGSMPSILSIYAGLPESERIFFVVKDDTDARRETLGFSGQTLDNTVTVSDSVIATIADDEIRPVVSMSLVDPTIVEGDALMSDYGVTSDLPGAVTLHVELDQAVTRDMTVDVNLSGDATPGVDYSLRSIYIAPSATLVQWAMGRIE